MDNEKRMAADIVVAYLDLKARTHNAKETLNMEPDHIADYFAIIYDRINKC